MELVVVGTNHTLSPLSVREKLSYTPGKLRNALGLLKEERLLFGGIVILSTCNRTELYFSSSLPEAAAEKAQSFFTGFHEVSLRHFQKYLYLYKGQTALRHLFSVAAGLDSLILGELQILGQIKKAVGESEQAGCLDTFLKNIFEASLRTAKEIHIKTNISEGKVSVGSVAVDFIRGKIGGFSGKNILLLGVGKVNGLVLKYLQKQGALVTFVSNRTYEKAKQLAQQIGAKAVRFDEIVTYLGKADVVITATASPHPILTTAMLSRIPTKLLIVDLALPRDVEEGAGALENIDLFGLEDLDALIRKNQARKAGEAKRAMRIVEKEAEKLWREYIESAHAPVLSP